MAQDSLREPHSAWRTLRQFALLQLFVAFGITAATTIMVYTTLSLLSALGVRFESRLAHKILTETHIFPVQDCIAISLGYIHYRRSRKDVSFWLWVLPLFVISLELMLWRPPSVIEMSISNRISHFFGTGCQIKSSHCVDQVLYTLPFYVSIAYSLGAFAAKVKLFSFEKIDIPPDLWS